MRISVLARVRKLIIYDVDKQDLEQFIKDVPNPKGIFLFVESSDEEEQSSIIKRIEKWY